MPTEQERRDKINEFVADRNEALLSMDKSKIIDFSVKWNVGLHFVASNDDLFWHSVHVARTGIENFPADEKLKSEEWLYERGFKTMAEYIESQAAKGGDDLPAR